MAELIKGEDDSVMIRLSDLERTGLSNVINHALHAGFVINEGDCGSLTGLEWNELQSLRRLLSEPQDGFEKSKLSSASSSQTESIGLGRSGKSAWAWVFSPSEGRNGFLCGIWLDRLKAEQWIESVGASGTLSAYVVDESAYDSNVRLARLKAEPPDRQSPEFKRRYTTAIDHAHFQDGRRV